LNTVLQFRGEPSRDVWLQQQSSVGYDERERALNRHELDTAAESAGKRLRDRNGTL
jgi:hypothetical protein